MRSFYKFLLVIAIIGCGLAIAIVLIKSKPQATRKPLSVSIPMVQVIDPAIKNEPIMITARGTVIPARQVTLQPEVAGTILWQSKNLVEGAHVRAKDRLIRIDDRDYRLTVQQQKAAVTRATVELKTERGRQAIARREWKLLEEDIETTREGRELALRIPQAKNAQAALTSAESALEKANLDLSRTVIRAPFNALVTDELVDVGQRVGPGSKIATLVGTDEFWIRASIPLSDLSWIDIPDINASRGSTARVVQENGFYRIERVGTVVRLLGDVDPKGRMARIIISVKDPLGLKRTSGDANFPLLLGSYVTIHIQGQHARRVCVIPRSALREGNRIWILTEDNRLQFRNVDVVWNRRDDVLIRNGFNPCDRIITNRIPTPTEGMKLRPMGRNLPSGEEGTTAAGQGS